MAAEASDMTAEAVLSRVCVFVGCAFCMSTTLRLPVLGSIFSVSRYFRSSSAKVDLEVGVSMEESCW